MHKLYSIILNYNSAQETIELYEQLMSFKILDMFVLIVDNASETEDVKQLRENIPPTNLIFNPENLGYAAGNTVGITAAISKEIPFVLLLNPDIRLTKNTISLLMQTISADEKIAVIGPRICYRLHPEKIYSDGGIIDKKAGFYTSHVNGDKGITEVDNIKAINKVDYVNGSVFLARTSVFNDIGFMLKYFFLYFEETEWCLRASKANYKLLVNTNVIAYHSVSNKGKLYYFYMVRNRLMLARIQNEFYFETIKAVGKPIWQEFIKLLRQRKLPTPILRAKAKGFFLGIAQNLN